MNCIELFLNRVLQCQSSKYHLVHNFTNMRAMSYRSDFRISGGRVDINEPTVGCAVSWISAVFWVGLPSFVILTAMLDSKSLNTSWLEVMISSKNERVFIHDLSDHTRQIIFDAWWASMNVDSKGPIAWNNCRHAPWWWFNLHCGIDETSSPGIICIVCHQALRHPSQHGTGSMVKHLLAKAHIARLNELTESEVAEMTLSTINETAFAILKRQGSRGITIVSSQRKIRFDIHVDPDWQKWQTKCSKLAAKDFETSEYLQDTWNRYLMLGIVSAHIPSNAISNLELRRSYKAFRKDVVLTCGMSLSNICRREYALTVNTIKKQLLSRNEVGLALDWWTSTNRLAITLGNACYMDRNWALREVRLAFDVVDRLSFSHFTS